jgi:hypothetical protein
MTKQYVIMNEDGRFLRNFSATGLFWSTAKRTVFDSKKEAKLYLLRIREAGWLTGDMEIIRCEQERTKAIEEAEERCGVCGEGLDDPVYTICKYCR